MSQEKVLRNFVDKILSTKFSDETVEIDFLFIGDLFDDVKHLIINECKNLNTDNIKNIFTDAINAHNLRIDRLRKLKIIYGSE